MLLLFKLHHMGNSLSRTLDTAVILNLDLSSEHEDAESLALGHALHSWPYHASHDAGYRGLGPWSGGRISKPCVVARSDEARIHIDLQQIQLKIRRLLQGP